MLTSSPWYTISEDCLWFTFSSVHCTASKHSTPVHQMQYYIPASLSPNKTLWCRIDTLVNSTSWIWYCLATAENPLFVASSGWRAHGSQDGLGGRDEQEGRWMVLTIMVLYDDGLMVWFGLPLGSGAKLKPRKSDYGVPRGVGCPVASWWALIYS